MEAAKFGAKTALKRWMGKPKPGEQVINWMAPVVVPAMISEIHFFVSALQWWLQSCQARRRCDVDLNSRQLSRRSSSCRSGPEHSWLQIFTITEVPTGWRKAVVASEFGSVVGSPARRKWNERSHCVSEQLLLFRLHSCHPSAMTYAAGAYTPDMRD